MSDYATKLKDPRWQRLRLEVMQRDGFKCRDCESAEKTLHVHHCGYRGKSPWETPVELLVTVCHECHEIRQSLEREAKDKLEEWFAKSSAFNISEFQPTSWSESDFDSSVRWYLYALEHPECREMYECVTKTKPGWALRSKKDPNE